MENDNDIIVPRKMAEIVQVGNKLYPNNMRLSALVQGIISNNFKPGIRGWFLNTNGEASFNNLVGGVPVTNMTSAARDALTNPQEGLLIYNTNTNKLNVYTGSWETISSS